MITLAQLKTAVRAFETTTLPPMSNAWDDLRRAMQDAITQYAAENNMTRAEVSKLVE